MSSQDKLVAELIRGLKHERDELQLQIHLASMEVREKLAELDDRLNALEHQYEPLRKTVATTAADVWDSMRLVGGELKAGFQRIRETL